MAINAEFNDDSKRVYTKSAYQYDKSQVLTISGIDLPVEYEAHISNSIDSEMAFICHGDENGVVIPDEAFVSGNYVYVWIYAADRTMLEIVIPVIPRVGTMLAEAMVISD